MKLNRKGFMMAEVVVVSAIVLVFLAGIYISYNQIYSQYKTRISYYDTVALYRVAYFRDILIENNVFGNALKTTKQNKVFQIYYGDKNGSNSSVGINLAETGNDMTDNVIIIYNNKKNLIGNELDSFTNIHQTFKDYITYLSTGVNLTSNDYTMVIEKCMIDNEDDCRYAYLEVYEGE